MLPHLLARSLAHCVASAIIAVVAISVAATRVVTKQRYCNNHPICSLRSLVGGSRYSLSGSVAVSLSICCPLRAVQAV